MIPSDQGAENSVHGVLGRFRPRSVQDGIGARIRDDCEFQQASTNEPLQFTEGGPSFLHGPSFILQNSGQPEEPDRGGMRIDFDCHFRAGRIPVDGEATGFQRFSQFKWPPATGGIRGMTSGVLAMEHPMCQAVHGPCARRIRANDRSINRQNAIRRVHCPG